MPFPRISCTFFIVFPLIILITHILVENIIGFAGAKEFKKIYPALAVRACKPGKELVADVGAIAILAIMTRTGIVYVYMRGRLETGG